MGSIQSTQGVGAPLFPQRPSRTDSQGPQKSKGDFGEALKGVIDKVDKDHRTSASAIQDLISGKTDDILPVVQEVAKADLSFKLLIGVRNKVIEAYQQTMRMQV
jgi:flagellar hook-basal body complex protein FliE